MDDHLPDPNRELLEFFKALSDATRLKIVGLLARQDLSVEQLAEIAGVRPPTVSHHLSRLQKAGLVSARAEGYYSIYHLETGAIEEMATRLLKDETLPAAAAQADLQAYDRKVLKTYLTPVGRLSQLPLQKKKAEVILRHVVQAFEPGRRYSEKQVNQILSGFHEDTAWLRRNLVESGLMARQGGGGEYWRVGPKSTNRAG